ncbi:MAG: hypothetical protein IT439_00135 [Phycisphaerales bacterium]|nr:hypothetical protein [Phycisphaerales bacterium]
MSVTAQLLRLYRVDQQISGLKSRLNAAQRFLDAQTRQLAEIETKREALAGQLRQLQASAANIEGEADASQVRIDHLRKQMDQARTNKEYQAFLVEVNTLKIDKSKKDEEALSFITKVDELKKLMEQLDAQRAERLGVIKIATGDRDKRADEIKDRLAELSAQRDALLTGVPAQAMGVYKDRQKKFGDIEGGVMAHIEIHDARRHEFTCASCQMNLPVQVLNALLNGTFSTCSSCGTILFVTEEDAERVTSRTKQ